MALPGIFYYFFAEVKIITEQFTARADLFLKQNMKLALFSLAMRNVLIKFCIHIDIDKI